MEGYPPIPMFSVGLLIGKRPFQDGAMLETALFKAHCQQIPKTHYSVGSVVKWLKHRTDDQHGLGSKPTCASLLCPWERHFTALSPAW